MTSRPFRYDFSLWYFLEDDPVATAISTTLRARGFRGYVEHQDQVAGASIVDAAGEIIEASRVALVLLSRRSVADRWCQRVAEWNLLQTMHRDGTKVVPIYVDVQPEEVPVVLSHLTGLHYHEKYFQERLLKSLQSGRRPPRRGRF